MIRLSIIVPFYNVEKYIEQCIRSLYDQDIPQDEYEVICVDDCSPDGSLGKIEELRTKNRWTNLTILRHTENKRQGGARNTGLAAAHGEYIWFVDSDDYVLPNVLGKLYEEAKQNNLDILHFNFEVCSEKGGIKQHVLCEDDKVYSGPDFVLDSYYDSHTNFSLCWAEWIRRDYLIKKNIFFAESVQFEDVDYAYRLYASAMRVKQSDVVAYHYVSRDGSTMNSPYTARKMYDHVMTIVRSEQILPTITHEGFYGMILRYVTCEISKVGSLVLTLPWRERVHYISLIKNKPLRIVRHRTSLRNWLRLRYGLPV